MEKVHFRSRQSLYVLGLLAGIALVGACTEAPATDTSTPTDHAAQYDPAVDAIFEAWNSRNMDVLDAALAPSFVREAPDQSAEGLDGEKAFISQAIETYPDFSITSDARGYAPGAVFVEWTASGTDSGEGGSGRPFEVSGTTKYLMSDGQITHEIVYYDTATLLRQLETETVPHTR